MRERGEGRGAGKSEDYVVVINVHAMSRCKLIYDVENRGVKSNVLKRRREEERGGGIMCGAGLPEGKD